MKAERVSYEVMTPSAARGLLEAILWKPAIQWEIHSIAVLAPIRWSSFRRNEVNSRASRGSTLIAEEDRAQRNTVALRDVDYGIEASFTLTGKAGENDSVRKFEEMFARRLEKGQHFQQPYLGCREFAASVEPWPAHAQPSEAADRPLGLMLFDFEYGAAGEAAHPHFFEARLQGGVLRVPPRAQLLSAKNGDRS